MASLNNMGVNRTVSDRSNRKYIARKLTLEDAYLFWLFFQALSSKSKSTFRPHPWTKYFAKKICSERFITSRGTKIVLTDVKGESILGYGFVNKVPFFPGIGYLGIGISDKYQGVGLGYGLIRNLLYFSKRDGFNTVWLNVFVQNEAATRLYEKVGFRKSNINFAIQKIISLNELIFNESFISALMGMFTSKREISRTPVAWMRKRLG